MDNTLSGTGAALEKLSNGYKSLHSAASTALHGVDALFEGITGTGLGIGKAADATRMMTEALRKHSSETAQIPARYARMKSEIRGLQDSVQSLDKALDRAKTAGDDGRVGELTALRRSEQALLEARQDQMEGFDVTTQKADRLRKTIQEVGVAIKSLPAVTLGAAVISNTIKSETDFNRALIQGNSSLEERNRLWREGNASIAQTGVSLANMTMVQNAFLSRGLLLQGSSDAGLAKIADHTKTITGNLQQNLQVAEKLAYSYNLGADDVSELTRLTQTMGGSLEETANMLVVLSERTQLSAQTLIGIQSSVADTLTSLNFPQGRAGEHARDQVSAVTAALTKVLIPQGAGNAAGLSTELINNLFTPGLAQYQFGQNPEALANDPRALLRALRGEVGMLTPNGLPNPNSAASEMVFQTQVKAYASMLGLNNITPDNVVELSRALRGPGLDESVVDMQRKISAAPKSTPPGGGPPASPLDDRFNKTVIATGDAFDNAKNRAMALARDGMDPLNKKFQDLQRTLLNFSNWMDSTFSGHPDRELAATLGAVVAASVGGVIAGKIGQDILANALGKAGTLLRGAASTNASTVVTETSSTIAGDSMAATIAAGKGFSPKLLAPVASAAWATVQAANANSENPLTKGISDYNLRNQLRSLGINVGQGVLQQDTSAALWHDFESIFPENTDMGKNGRFGNATTTLRNIQGIGGALGDLLGSGSSTDVQRATLAKALTDDLGIYFPKDASKAEDQVLKSSREEINQQLEKAVKQMAEDTAKRPNDTDTLTTDKTAITLLHDALVRIEGIERRQLDQARQLHDAEQQTNKRAAADMAKAVEIYGSWQPPTPAGF